MNGLIQIPIRDGSKFKDFIFPDVKTFVIFAEAYIKETGMALMKLPEDGTYHFDKFKKLKYSALTIDENNEIEVIKFPSRANKEGLYLNKILAKGKEEVIQFLKEEDGF